MKYVMLIVILEWKKLQTQIKIIERCLEESRGELLKKEWDQMEEKYL